MSKEFTECPLVANHRIIINNKPITTIGTIKISDNGLCFVKTLQKQTDGLIAAKGYCDRCDIYIQIGTFVGPSVASLTVEEND